MNIFEKLGCNIPSNRTEPCHRVSTKSETVIIKFSQRTNCQQVLAAKKDLREVKMEDFHQPGQNNFIE